jgi:hypothetical protein
MKKVFLAFLLLASMVVTVTAQTKAIDESLARTTADQLTAKYGLNADQAKTVYTIQVRKLKNMAAIESYQSNNPALYQTKLANVQEGTLKSLRRTLKSKEQVAIFQKTQAEVRQQKAAKRKALMAQKATKAEIEAALNQIYAE